MIKKHKGRYWKLRHELEAQMAGKEQTFLVPVKFRLKFNWDGVSANEQLGELDDDGYMEDKELEAAVMPGKGINRVQRAVLQEGIDNVIGDACERIYKLFPHFLAEPEAAFTAYNQLMVEIGETDLTHRDFAEGKK